MKTPDEIKKGLECCKDYQSCTDYGEPKCPYNDVRECVDTLLADAHSYIQQLEAERDALIEELKNAYSCFACKKFFRNGGECKAGGVCLMRDFEWRGVQKEE